VDVFHAAAPFITFLFHWAYTVLYNPAGPIGQSGDVVAHAITSFGWFVNCTDCIEGAATATITNFQAQTAPEPATLALIGLGLAASCFMRRRVS
jgi:hypothetical protein